MAYAALISLKQALEKILNPHQEIQSLMEKVCYLLDFLEDVSSSEKHSLLMGCKDLEGKMRDAAYEGEDIIELSHLSKQNLPKAKSSFSLREKCFTGIRSLIPSCHQFETVDHDSELEIKDLQKIIQEFDSMLESVSKIKNGKVVEPLQPARKSFIADPSRIASSEKSATVGLNRELTHIKDQLTGSSSHLEIISIVGMGGIGKTTLATNLYNDSLINYHFHIRAWVTVSQDYLSQKIVRDLHSSIVRVNGESHSQMSIDLLAENLYKSLKGRTYLIVMDDVWDTKVWDDVKRLFPDDKNGSRIILTTRLSEVALYVTSSSSIHHMNLLSLEESWKLLCEKVFGEKSCPSEFEKIGKKIARNCKGLPLAIVLIGGILSRSSLSQVYWEYIARNVMSSVTGSDDQLMDILSLSYDNLPHHLKACFLYMGVFPEDHEISVSRLIKLWLAEGFLMRYINSENLEEVAEEYLKDLIDRNLVMVRKRNHYGGVKTCIIHDLLRDLCVKKAQEERFLLVLNHSGRDLPEVGYSFYRISIHSRIFPIDIHDSRARSFLYFAENYSGNLSLSFVRFRLLKVLDASAITFYQFPIEILQLVNLRYLAFTCGSKMELPAAIGKLNSLQTLILSSMFGVRHESWHLPSEILKMPQLRHISFKKGLLPCLSLAQRNNEMVHLHTLSEVENLLCTKEVFQIMPNLKKLGISYDFYWSDERRCYDFNSFVYLHQLETLRLTLNRYQYLGHIPINFAFPLKLRKLNLRGCRISWDNMTIVGSLPNLQVLKLKDSSFKRPVWEPKEGEFIRLKYLFLEMSTLEHWEANEMHFPNLAHLSLKFCFDLDEIPTALGNIPTLQILEVIKCSNSVMKSAKLIEEEQRSLGNDSLKVRTSGYMASQSLMEKVMEEMTYRNW